MSENEDGELRLPEIEVTLGSPATGDPDAPHVGPTLVGGWSIGGGIEWVNDGGEALVNARVTHYEAETLFRHWFERKREADEFSVIYHQSGSSEWRESVYAGYRLGVLEDYVSKGFVVGIATEVARRNAEVKAAREP